MPAQPYNIGSEEAVTIADPAQRVRDHLSPYREVVILGEPRDGQRSRYVPVVSQIAALGAAARTNLDRISDDTAGRLSFFPVFGD